MTDVLGVQAYGRVKLLQNGKKIVELEYDPADDTWELAASERVVLATGMSSPQEISLGDIGASNTGKFFALKTDRSIQVALDDSTSLWTLEDNGGMLFVGSFSHVYVKNTGSNEATVRYLAADGT